MFAVVPTSSGWHRPGALPARFIHGEPTSDPAAELKAAHAFLAAAHAAPCRPDTPLLFKRWPTFGVSNDLNILVRGLAFAIGSGRQLVLLPPNAEGRAKVRPVAGELGTARPWHWLQPGLSTSTLVEPSSCQSFLDEHKSTALDALSAAQNAADLLLLARLNVSNASRCSDFDASDVMRGPIEFTSRWVPAPFQRHGTLWWFQALTTFLIRPRGALADLLKRHAAWRPFLRPGPLTMRHDLPDFDIGLHVRVGDACGQGAVRLHFESRMCLRSLHEALTQLPPASDGGRRRLFLASDSQAVVDEAAQVSGFDVTTLALDRAKYAANESVFVESRLPHRSSDVLVEALMDLLLLSRARVIAGGMYGNMPRLAMQLRVRPPGDDRQYASLDGHRWCTCTSCKGFPEPSNRTSEGGK